MLRGTERLKIDASVKALNTNGATAALWVVPVGTDMARGWGKRRSVAEDFLFDSPVMLGSQRVGPDLASVGSRLPDPHTYVVDRIVASMDRYINAFGLFNALEYF